MPTSPSVKQTPLPCPRCQGEPEIKKGPTYWQVACPKEHMPRRMLGHPMKTKTDAISAWNDAIQNGTL